MPKRNYKPGLARLKFKPDYDWETKDAKILYEAQKFPFQVDLIHYIELLIKKKKI